jgi:G3E family GTPase
VAVVVNEFGELGIDARLIVARDEEVVELANGCLCCRVRGDLVEALHGLLDRRERRFLRQPFERLAIETSGLASPGPVLTTFVLELRLRERTEIQGVVTLAHAALIEGQLAEHPEAREQVALADLLLLNHVDRVADAARAERALRAHNPMAPLQRTRHADVAVAEILAPRAPELATLAAHTREHEHDPHGTSTVLRSRSPLDRERLRVWLAFLASRRGATLWRVKGLLACGDDARAVVVQGVGPWIEVARHERLDAPSESVLVVIGRDLDRAELERGWRAAHG